MVLSDIRKDVALLAAGARGVGAELARQITRPRSDVRGQVVLITGAARGIGAETARQLSRRGARLALVDIDGAELERFAKELEGEVACFTADVTGADSIAAAVAGAVRRFGGIDVAIANAGISGVSEPVRLIADENFERVVETNLLGVWRTLRAALPYVVERRGYLLPIASIAAVVPLPFNAAYAATKGGVEQLARTMDMELAHTGTRVGVAYFGFIETPLVQGVFSDPAPALLRELMPGFVRNTRPVEKAAAAIVRGIERRSRTVYAPGWVPGLLLLRLPTALLIQAMAGQEWFAGKLREAEVLVVEQQAAREHGAGLS